ncbi:hypothetical protein [Paenibacillus arenilitoris]|uniref:Uncharacterized protein n=1 Tax=Paenibacillus arenilitoris TaxID=2772299 RepID=A0A927CQY0_9BACL|nr:hypothetical protein [Paenibacillus arenilitoris]MBD2870010.1 hypothetical protein [Paenibacillus arenilitoris]
MKTNRIARWAMLGIAGIAAVLLLAKAAALFGHTNNYVFIPHGPGRGGHGAYLAFRKIEHHPTLADWFAPAWMFLKLAVLAAAMWLWSKSSGILRGAGAAAAGIALASLLSPIWGALLAIAMLVWKPKNKSIDALASYGGAPLIGGGSYAGADAAPLTRRSSDTGTYLDEWERKTRESFK